MLEQATLEGKKERQTERGGRGEGGRRGGKEEGNKEGRLFLLTVLEVHGAV